jgi:hypothetical protein
MPVGCVSTVLKKWSRGHKCGTTVHLHVVQELWALFQDDQEIETSSVHSNIDSQCHMLLSKEVVSVKSSASTLKFLVNI